MRKVIILQARLASSRFPNKVLAELSGKPVIAHVIERLRQSTSVDEICVAIPNDASEDKLAEALKGIDARTTRGSSNDVLSRYIQAAYETDAQVIVRATADNALVDWHCVDQQIEALSADDLDYVITDGFPVGVTVETFTLKTLEKLDFLARDRDHREHVTLYVRQNPGPFNVRHLKAPEELQRPDWSLSINRPENLELVQAIYDRLADKSQPIEIGEVIGLLDTDAKLRDMALLPLATAAA